MFSCVEFFCSSVFKKLLLERSDSPRWKNLRSETSYCSESSLIRDLCLEKKTDHQFWSLIFPTGLVACMFLSFQNVKKHVEANSEQWKIPLFSNVSSLIFSVCVSPFADFSSRRISHNKISANFRILVVFPFIALPFGVIRALIICDDKSGVSLPFLFAFMRSLVLWNKNL